MTTVIKAVYARAGPAGYHRRLSACYYPNSNLVVEYAEGWEVFPTLKGSKLFAFRTLEDAKAFFGATPDTELWEAEGTNVHGIRLIAATGMHAEQFWAIRRSKKAAWSYPNKVYRDHAPKGSVVCDSITLLRRIPHAAKS